MTNQGGPDLIRRSRGVVLVSVTTAIAIANVPAPAARPLQTPSTVVQAAAAQPADKGWPRGYTTTSGAKVLVHQPQVATWTDQRHLTTLAAVAYTAAGANEPSYGTVKIESDTSVAMPERLVRFTNLAVTEATFASLSREQTRELASELTSAIPQEQRVIALDRVLTSIDKSSLTPKPAAELKADPPVIHFSKTPAVLVNLDGKPIWSPIKGNDLKFAVNTNWDLFLDESTKTHYLRDEDTWFSAAEPTGPWQVAAALPPSFAALPDDENWKDTKANLPGKRTRAKDAIIVSTEPAELIALGGEPRYEPVAGTSLLWVSNADLDIFRQGASGPVYLLVSGRWFAAPDFTGPWSFATPNLPEEFKKIPRSHPRAHVLSSVPGTDQAMEAVLLAETPKTARVNARELEAPKVVYQGAPEFQPIEGVSAERAVNTDKDIIKVNNRYYMCFQAVWFVADNPEGPWQVTDSVPGEIYEIPASSPSHHVSYVTVEEDDDDSDEWETFAYAAGYCGMMVGWGCAMWGTGWYYPPYYWYGSGYWPVYYPYMRTYGYGAWYNPWTGTYGASARVYGPYGGAAFGARYNPYTGTYARGAAAWGPYGGRGVAEAWNPRTGTYAATRQGSSMYRNWGSTYVQRGDDWMHTKRVTNNRTGNTTRVTRTDEGAAISRKGQDGRGFVGKGNDNVYAGKDGSVYRRNENGQWQKWDQGSWNQVERPDSGAEKQFKKSEKARRESASGGVSDRRMDSSTFRDLERERSARSEAKQRSRDFDNYNRNRSYSGGSRGSYGGSRGGYGGGGRRGGFGGGGRRGGRF
jgi:hypothetical protein